MNCSGRAFSHAFLAKLALREIYIGEIVFNGNCPVRTYFGTFATSYAGCRAGFTCHSALVLVDTADIDPHAARTFVPEFDDILRAGLHAGSTCGTFLLVHFRQTCLRIHLDGSELACSHTVTATETAERTSRITAVKGSFDTAGRISAIIVYARAVCTCTVTPDRCDHRGFLLHLHAEHGCNFLHCLIATDRTEIVVQIWGFDTRLGEGTASCMSASSAVSSWKHLLHIVDPRIFLHLELCSHKIQDDGNISLKLFFLDIEHEIIGQFISKQVNDKVIQGHPSYRRQPGINFVLGNGRQR